MRAVKWLFLFLCLSFTVALSAAGVSADARINVWSHFGGDALYCNHDQGCSALNMSGNPLWSVPEAAIVKAVSDACATNDGVVLAAGQGTYGPMSLVVTCPNGIIVTGFDEWGKWNSMAFTTDYLPVNPASDPHSSSATSFVCSVDLNRFNAVSEDGIHDRVGYDIYSVSKTTGYFTFLHWSATTEGKQDCPEVA